MNKLELIFALQTEAKISKLEAAKVVIKPKKLPFFKSEKELKNRGNS